MEMFASSSEALKTFFIFLLICGPNLFQIFKNNITDSLNPFDNIPFFVISYLKIGIIHLILSTLLLVLYTFLMKGAYIMDNYNNNKATPKKRTGDQADNYTDSDKDNNTVRKTTPEIIQPNPPSATPSFPPEIPSRDTRTEI